MKIFESPREMQDSILNLKRQDSSMSVGFVPTMGALHSGHKSLLDLCREQNSLSILSIFVNPTQFNDPTDFQKYPKTLEADLKIADSAGVDIVFLPTYKTMYPDNYSFKLTELDFSKKLCGAHRPGHFDGVLTIVLKLLQLTQAERAYFGEKDYQQLTLIKKMCDSLFLTTQIIACPTLRESDGLAMSSRNTRLTAEQRHLAPKLFSIISQAQSAELAHTELQTAGFKVDYVVDDSGRRYAAAFLGDVRLIDNVKI